MHAHNLYKYTDSLCVMPCRKCAPTRSATTTYGYFVVARHASQQISARGQQLWSASCIIGSSAHLNLPFNVRFGNSPHLILPFRCEVHLKRSNRQQHSDTHLLASQLFSHLLVPLWSSFLPRPLLLFAQTNEGVVAEHTIAIIITMSRS